MTLTFDSLLCLFTRHMPLKSVLRLWDILLLEGDAAIFAVLLALLERLVDDPGAGSWDNFPFAERLKDHSAHADVEELIARAKAHQDWQEGPRLISLRARLQHLRREAISAPPDAPLAALRPHPVGVNTRVLRSDSRSDPAAGWWEQALSHVRAFFDDDDDAGGGGSGGGDGQRRRPPPLPRHGGSFGGAYPSASS